MGDFEDTFGAGANAVDVIDRFVRQEIREERRASKNSNSVKGEPRIFFATYDEAILWEKKNLGTPFVRRRKGNGYEVEIVL